MKAGKSIYTPIISALNNTQMHSPPELSLQPRDEIETRGRGDFRIPDVPSSLGIGLSLADVKDFVLRLLRQLGSHHCGREVPEYCISPGRVQVQLAILCLPKQGR